MELFILTLTLAGIAILLLFVYNWRRMNYWAARGVPCPPGLPFIGHFQHLFMGFSHRHLFLDKWYRKFRHSRFIGFYEFSQPTLLVCDPEDMKDVFVKEFDHFVDRREVEGFSDSQIFGEMVSLLNGEKWKAVRAVMTPTFSSGKMKNMYPLVEEKVDILLDLCEKLGNEPFIDMKDIFGRYTMDVIASCAFGIECNSLINPDAVFPKKADVFFGFSTLVMLKFTFVIIFPRLSKFLRINLEGPEGEFFVDTVKHTIAVRTNVIKRGDFLDLMLEEKLKHEDDAAVKYPIKMSTIISQSVLFLIAGYDTTANCLSFTSFLLAKHPQQQQRLRQELKDLTEAGKFNYQGLMESKLLDAFINESLRLWPVAQFTERQCTKDYKFPGTELKITKGTVVVMPAWSLHHDPAYWDDPEEFRPDRFLPENRDSIKPYSYMPFGHGPRNCLGMRFALMEIKLALAKLLLRYQLQLAPGLKEVELEKNPNMLRPAKSGIRLVLKPLDS